MSIKTVSKSVNITVCDLCGEYIGDINNEIGFQHLRPLKAERPLKSNWYHVLRWLYDGNPTYEVHHTCLYELLKAFQEGKLTYIKGDER